MADIYFGSIKKIQKGEMRMTFKDTIDQVTIEKESDGMGGFKKKNVEHHKLIECKASFNTNPEISTAFGLTSEKILYLVTQVPLKKNAYFLFNDEKYTIRYETRTLRHCFYTLIEVKKGA